MTQKLKQIHALQNLSQMKLNQSLSQLSTIAAQEEKLREALAQLDDEVEMQRSSAENEPDISFQALSLGLDVKWAQWVKREKRKQLKSLAAVAEKRELQLVETRRAFGRVEALKGIAKKMQG